MTDLEIYQSLRAQFRLIDNNLDALALACQTFSQSQQLSDEWNRSNVNYVKARNKIFDANSETIQQLFNDLQVAQKEIEASIDDLKNIAVTLDKISDGVRLGTSLVGLGTLV